MGRERANDLAAGLPLRQQRTFKLTLAYDGTDYFGWQYQPDRPTVQAALEAALGQITQEKIRVSGSGRTDAGVHALGQVVSFHATSRFSTDVLQRALNATLPRDMCVVDLVEVAAGFHAIRDCLRKRYRYLISNGPILNIFSRRYAWHLFQPLDVAAMHRAAQPLLGRHDFASFQTQGTQRESTVRTVHEIAVTRGAGQGGGTHELALPHPATASMHCVSLPSDLICMEIEADGFLYNMVRTIVGTLVAVGSGKQPEGWPAEVLAAGDRRLAGMTAPPQGLFLLRADY